MSEQATSIDPVMPEVKMNLVKANAPVTGRVVSNDLCVKGGAKSASFVRHTEIDVSGTPLAGNFLVGQSFGVIAPGVDEKGKPHKVRLYSVACPSWGEDGKGNVVSTTPKRLIDEYYPQRDDDPQRHTLFLGVCSNFLCDLDVGDEVQVTGPAGKRFLLPVGAADHEYLFIATGTGIAPFRGMVMELLNRPDGPCPGRIHLVMGVPYTTDLLYHDLFTKLADKHENFHYHTAISRERYGDSERGVYCDGLIDRRMDTFGPLLENPRTLVYQCGLLGMDRGFYRVLLKHGLADSYITIADEFKDTDPASWSSKDVKRHVRPTSRCMVEVY